MSRSASGWVRLSEVVVAAQVAAVVLEALAAEIGLAELQGLDLGAHGAVEHEDALARRLRRSAR